MLFDCKNPAHRIVGVEHMQWKCGSFDIAPRDYASLAFRMRGTATVTAGGKSYCVNTNEILYLPQGLPYLAQYSDTEILVIHFVTEKNDPCPEVYSVGDTGEIYRMFVRAQMLWQSKAPGFEAYVLAQLYTILGALCEKETVAQVPVHFLNAVSYMQTHYTESTLSIETVCAAVGISGTTLRQLFRAYSQKSPTQYITELRLEYARNLISCGSPVEQAAEKSGFSDPKYFSRVVKKYFSCTPRQLKLYGK